MYKHFLIRYGRISQYTLYTSKCSIIYHSIIGIFNILFLIAITSGYLALILYAPYMYLLDMAILTTEFLFALLFSIANILIITILGVPYLHETIKDYCREKPQNIKL